MRGRDRPQTDSVDIGNNAVWLPLTNDKHLEKPEGSRTRGKRTIAKERVYRHILAGVRTVSGRKNFNIGISTGMDQGWENRWLDAYRHWLFKPSDGAIRPEFAKKRQK